MARHGKAKARAKRGSAMETFTASPHRFTMQQEARNTETHSRWWSNSNLRHKAVRFVSAGTLQRKELEGVEQEDRDLMVNAPGRKEPEVEGSSDPSDPKTNEQGRRFFLDTSAQLVVDTGLPDPVPRFDSTDSEDSSEDEVVFAGRNNTTRPVVIESSNDEVRKILDTTLTEQRQIPLAAEAREPEQAVQAQPDDLLNSMQSSARPDTCLAHSESPRDEVDALADYIANIDSEYHLENIHSHIDEFEGGIDVTEVSKDSSLLPPWPSTRFSRPQSQTFERDIPTAGGTDEDLVQSSIDGELPAPIPRIPNHPPVRYNPDKEESVLSRMYIDAQLEPEFDSALAPDDEAEEDTDPLDSPDADSDEEEEIDTDLLEELAVRCSTERKKGNRGKISFASATAFADALESDPYYGFDIMDLDRPSLHKKSKGQKHPALDVMLSDSDLELHLQEVWQTDRNKKKTRKKEREELRSQGLLGRSPGDADLKVKYAKGMNLEELMTEFRAFLLSSKTSLSLPPMTKQRRKTIHELANILNLKSQSRGNGLTRFPMLVKTSRTPGYTSKTISKVDDLLSGRKLNRRLFQSWGSDASKYKPVKTKRGGSGATVSYMDGDVVGASAPEIGVGNRGRAMLEKMGWSSGTALGATNNKGILLPVAHVVKNSRTGLG
ncbi:hypothetical protein N7462_001491 [Penicillium macrosclerotiorum]|uniref:uncharacterized protein n=1 Tax=Penicillium macrosclerotiorum TaxID=303699 RepID=UPI002547B6AE|nr:uncharacterized protein N7462_001491 [Penicillium macrosclerotiorum]KAJ5692068.1 hypothetical protein N7462_001491 [Penicillium macrosclerotiorum]